jgi:hypothetical protein
LTKRLLPIPTLRLDRFTHPAPPPASEVPITAIDAAVGSIEVEFLATVADEGNAPFSFVSLDDLGAPLQKTGARTGHTTNGIVVGLGGSVLIDYGGGTAWAQWARIGQDSGTALVSIASTDGQPFALPGDSGSLVFLRQRAPHIDTYPCAALVFGMNAAGTSVYASNITTVKSILSLDGMCSGLVRELINAIA